LDELLVLIAQGCSGAGLVRLGRVSFFVGLLGRIGRLRGIGFGCLFGGLNCARETDPAGDDGGKGKT